ncbi:hypothetical protein MRS44_002944 [Fusarium solani]|uniref:uncharacterized protein n=1 Tax=Fusarium solani TaxID=169388 RepID=UPI0032C440BF|nr:hypothetical protein MRS44_002944 [Fusarium solani]
MTAPPSSLLAPLTVAIAPLGPTRSAAPARDPDLAPPTVAAPLRAPSLAATAMGSTILHAPPSLASAVATTAAPASLETVSLSPLSRPLRPQMLTLVLPPGRSSYYKRSPRQGFIQKTYKQLKRLLRDLVHWAKRHPWKVFFLVIMPLITGGALTALLARFGLRIPPAIERMLGVASKAATGDSSGLVGEAVRMASGFGGNTSVRMERDTRSFSGGRGDDSWGSGLADMAKKWM